MAEGVSRPEWLVLDPSMWASRRETGLAKSVAEVYEDELGVAAEHSADAGEWGTGGAAVQAAAVDGGA